MAAKYDSIGVGYAALRKPDPRIATAVWQALGSARTVVNVGAGTGSYEPPDRIVTAVEPSIEMIRQRPENAASVIQATAEDLPFADDSFDAAMAILTIHHWPDPAKGVQEMRRVSRGPVVLLTYDPAFRGAWLTDYIPELIALDDVQMPALSRYTEWLGRHRVETVPIPHDCLDGFLYAYWRRPHAYLDSRLRAGSSSFWAIRDIDARLNALAKDLECGEWDRRYSHLKTRDSLDLGYRLVIAE